MNLPLSNLGDELAKLGVCGLVIAILFFLLWRKDQELSAERAARVTDAKEMTALAMKIQADVLKAVERLGDVLDSMKRVVEDREDRR